MRLVARTRLGVDDPGLAPSHQLRTHELEVVGVGDLMNELAALLTFFLFFFYPLLVVTLGFVLVLIDDLLDLLFFFGRIFLGERFVVFFDEPLHLLAVELKNFVSLRLGGLGFSLAVELAVDVAFNVGVVAFLLVILVILVHDHAQQLLHLLLGEFAAGVGRKVEVGALLWLRRFAGRWRRTLL